MTIEATSGFTLEQDSIDLPQGAWNKGHRQTLRWCGREVLGFTQGSFRSYLHPVFSPAGFALTAESPPDHPHHSGIWIAADHVACAVPAGPGRYEHYAYNFYVNETFQGRAPGSIRDRGLEVVSADETEFRAIQHLDWVGPPEWGAGQGRLVAVEERRTTVRAQHGAYLVDLQCVLRPSGWDLILGPTRHGLFNMRVAESMRTANGGVLIDADGRRGGHAVSEGDAAWVDFSGPVGGGHRAGLALMAGRGHEIRTWFATDWGIVTLQPFRDRVCEVSEDRPLVMETLLVLHDGDADEAGIAAAYRRYAGRTNEQRRDHSPEESEHHD